LDYLDWFELLSLLGSVFPSLKDLGWTNETEGNDLMMHDQFHKNLRDAVLIDFFPFIVEHFSRVPTIPPSMQHLGMVIQEGGVYRRGHRVVCDRIRRNNERPITAWLELYNKKGKLVSREEVGNRADLTHSEMELDYRNCEWMVIRIGHGRQPIWKDDFNDLRLHEDDLETHDEGDHHQNPNPFEAFVTLPWFIRLDNKGWRQGVERRGVGILGEDSRQLVHVHFTETVSSSQGDSVAIIPLCVEMPKNADPHKGLKPKMRGRKSFTTICFRAMFLTSLSEERGMSDREDVADPGSAWWVERPST
jgi:hypothetical protein